MTSARQAKAKSRRKRKRSMDKAVGTTWLDVGKKPSTSSVSRCSETGIGREVAAKIEDGCRHLHERGKYKYVKRVK